MDAIVNAANSRMRGGGESTAPSTGPADPPCCRTASSASRAGWHRGCRLDHRGRLPARWVIHTVGPNYTAGQRDRSLLVSCYARSLQVADELGADTMAFPLISAGIYGWPKPDAIAAAIETLGAAETKVTEVRIVAFDAATFADVQARLG